MKTSLCGSWLIIAAIAALAFVSCPGPDDGGEEGTPLTGNVVIWKQGSPIGPNNAASTGDTLIANYSGRERVSFQWKFEGQNVGADYAYFIPEDPGSYTVTVSAPDYQSKTSAPVSVGGSALPALPGTLSITVNGAATTTAKTGDELTAVYSGSEEVLYQWYKDDVSFTTTGSREATTYTPAEAGSYVVKVYVTPRTHRTLSSAPVAVTGATLVAITFELDDPNNDNPVKLTAPGSPIGALPPAPARNGFTLQGWYTQPSGSAGMRVTENSIFNEATTVYARWQFSGGIPYIDTDTNTLVHENPLMEKGSGFAGDISTEDGTISFTAGAFQYKFPAEIDGTAINISEYTYFIVKFDLKSESGSGSGVILKQYNSSADYGGKEGNDRYPWLSNEGNGTRFTIAGAGSTGGFSIQYNGGTTKIEVRVTSITFHKQASLTVTFDLDGGTGTAPAATVYAGETLGAKYPANPTKATYTFVGWKDADGARVTAVTPITKNLTLKAQWVATSEFGADDDWIEFITTTATSAPVYVFDIGTDTLNDYDHIMVKIKSDDAVSGRLRAWGVYALNGFTFAATPTRPNMQNTVGEKLLTNPGLDSFSHAVADGWKEYKLPLNAITATNQTSATGQLAIAFGVIAQSGGGGTRPYYVKDIKLAKIEKVDTVDTVTKSTEATRPDDSSLWSGNGASAYVTSDTPNVVARQLLPYEADD